MRVWVAVLFLVSGCRDWRQRVEPSRVAEEPEQVALVDEAPIELESKEHHIELQPRATYRITGYAAETSRTLLDEWDFVMPMDLALVWGPIADPAVLSHLKFHLSERYVSYWYDASTPPAVVGELPSHIANNHLIPATEDVASTLRRIRVGDLVTLRGKLVDVEIHSSSGKTVLRLHTSLSRTDVGSGACEIMWVEGVDLERPQ